MNTTLIIIGASGHGKVIADLAETLQQYKEIYFLDDDPQKKSCMGYQVIGTNADIDRYVTKADFAVAIGNAKVREKILEGLLQRGANVPVLVHPNACVAKNVQIGAGTVVMAGSVIQADSYIGKGCIVNTCSSVDHECVLEDYVHVAVGAHLAGAVEVGKSTWIGAGATVSNNIKICEECMIGAGAVVVKNIEQKGTYIGVPTRMKMPLEKEKIQGGISDLKNIYQCVDFWNIRRAS